MLALIEAPDSLSDLPVVGPKTAGQLRDWLAAPEPELATRKQVEDMLGLLATLPMAKGNEAEGRAKVQVYADALSDVAYVDLRAAYDRLIRECRFFPCPKEIRDAAARTAAVRSYRRSRAKCIVARHEREWTEPTEMADPAEVKALLRHAA